MEKPMWCHPKSERGRSLNLPDPEDMQPVDAARYYLRRLQRHKLELVASEFRRENGISAHLMKRVVREYRRFLALHVANPGMKIQIGGLVDMFWHHHILFTKDYRTMCSATGRFIDHVPRAARDKGYEPSPESQVDSAYTEAFACARESRLWTGV